MIVWINDPERQQLLVAAAWHARSQLENHNAALPSPHTLKPAILSN